MTRSIEERLRVALGARAEQISPESLRPSVPPWHRCAGWLLPATVAAAVVAALAVPGAFAAQRLTAERLPANPGVTERSSTPLSPTTTPLPSVATVLPPASTASVESAAPPMRGRPVGSGPGEVTYDGMTVQLPAGWTLSEVIADPNRACVWSSSPDRCELTVVTADSGVYHRIHPDDPAQVADQLDCASDDLRVSQLEATTVDIGIRSAQYRKYRMTCLGTERDFEQWTFATQPAVKLHRAHITPDTEAAVREIVASARFGTGGTHMLLTDFGFIVGYQRFGDEVELTVDRATPVWRARYRFDARNENPTTYPYRIPSGAAGVFDREPGLCRTGAFDANPCDLPTLLMRLDEGNNRTDGGVPVRQIPVWLHLNANEEVVGIAVA